MGCDIHAYIETSSDFRGKKNYYLWAHPNFNRSYLLFGLLSKGVRWDTDLGMEPKGIPDDIDFYTSQEYYITVDDERAGERFCTMETAEKYVKYGATLVPSYARESDGYVFPAKVSNPDWHSASWLSIDELEEVVKRWRALPVWNTTRDISRVRVEEGITLEQLRERLEERMKKPPRLKMKSQVVDMRDGWATYVHEYKVRRPGVSKDLLATIAAMKALRDKHCEPRLVFWFDN